MESFLSTAAPYVSLLAAGIASIAAAAIKKLLGRIEILETKVQDHEQRFAVSQVYRENLKEDVKDILGKLEKQDEVLANLGEKLNKMAQTMVPRNLCEGHHRRLEGQLGVFPQHMIKDDDGVT